MPSLGVVPATKSKPQLSGPEPGSADHDRSDHRTSRRKGRNTTATRVALRQAATTDHSTYTSTFFLVSPPHFVYQPLALLSSQLCEDPSLIRVGHHLRANRGRPIV